MAQEKQMPPSASLVFLLCSLYREHSSLNNFAVRDEQAPPVPALLCSLYHEPALTRFTACCAGCSFSNGTRKTNAAFGVACFFFCAHYFYNIFTSFVHCFPTRGTYYQERILQSRILRLRRVAQATFFHSAAVRSSRSVFIVWKRSFLYDKKTGIAETAMPFFVKISIPQALCAEGIARRTSSSALRS